LLTPELYALVEEEKQEEEPATLAGGKGEAEKPNAAAAVMAKRRTITLGLIQRRSGKVLAGGLMVTFSIVTNAWNCRGFVNLVPRIWQTFRKYPLAQSAS